MPRVSITCLVLIYIYRCRAPRSCSSFYVYRSLYFIGLLKKKKNTSHELYTCALYSSDISAYCVYIATSHNP